MIARAGRYGARAMQPTDDTRWRARTTSGKRRAMLFVTALIQIVVGAIALLVVIGLAVGVVGAWALLLSAVPMVLVTWRAVRSRTPARVEDAQPWNEYVLRATLIGSGDVRSTPVRLVTGLVLGGPLALFVLIMGIFELGANLGV